MQEFVFWMVVWDVIYLILVFQAQLWSAKAIIDPKYNDLVVNAHTDYIEAGCDIITTSNFNITPLHLQKVCKNDSIANYVSKYIKLSVKLASDARVKYYNKKNRKHKKILIAGSVPPLSICYDFDKILSKNDSINIYGIILDALLSDSKIDINSATL